MLTILRKTAMMPVIAALAAPAAYAHCPLCTAAVGTAAVTAKYFGMDASVIGIFIGAFGTSTGLWLALKLKKKIPLQTLLIVGASFLLTAIPLMRLIPDAAYVPVLWAGEPGSILNRIYWLNKMLAGSITGGIVTIAAYNIHAAIKKARGKVLFQFQGIAITAAALAITALITYIITR